MIFNSNLLQTLLPLVGHGKTKEEATENAVEWAYSYLQKQFSETNNSSSDSPHPNHNPFPSDEELVNLPRSSSLPFRDILMQCSQIDVDAPIITSSEPNPSAQPVPETIEDVEEDEL